MKNWLLRRGWWHQQRIDVVCDVNCMIFFNAWCVKDVEWSIIRVRWANRRLGQYAGEWSSCERFFLIFWGCCGCKGPRQRSADTRGCRGTAAHFYNHRDFFFFFFDHRHCEVLHFDVKHCWLTVKSVSTIKNWLQCRRTWCWERSAANFLLLKHFWQYVNNVFPQWRTSHWRCDQ
jgi:hypothetical protein